MSPCLGLLLWDAWAGAEEMSSSAKHLVHTHEDQSSDHQDLHKKQALSRKPALGKGTQKDPRGSLVSQYSPVIEGPCPKEVNE